MGADPVSYAVALASLREPPIVQAFTVRKEAKGHGTRRRIEGNFTPGAAVVVTEDVITSGGSALQAIRAVEEEGGTVLGILAVVDREEGGRGAIEAAGYPWSPWPPPPPSASNRGVGNDAARSCSAPSGWNARHCAHRDRSSPARTAPRQQGRGTGAGTRCR